MLLQQDRLRIYRLALKDYKASINIFGFRKSLITRYALRTTNGLCEYFFFNHRVSIWALDELVNYADSRGLSVNEFWFPKRNIRSRINLLKKVIKQLEKEIIN